MESSRIGANFRCPSRIDFVEKRDAYSYEEGRKIEEKPFLGPLWHQLEPPAVQENGSWRSYWGCGSTKCRPCLARNRERRGRNCLALITIIPVSGAKAILLPRFEDNFQSMVWLDTESTEAIRLASIIESTTDQKG